MPFVTVDPATLPARSAFGRDARYTNTEVQEAIRTLHAGKAVGDGLYFEDRKKAHNAATTLRSRVKKADPDLPCRTVAVEDPARSKKKQPAWTWYLSPDVPAAPKQEPASHK
jgi:hypothetical protein